MVKVYEGFKLVLFDGGLFWTLVAADTCSSPMPSGMLISQKARFEIELAKGGIIPGLGCMA